MDMKYKITPMDDSIAKTVSTWRYPGDYSVYNLPSYEAMKEQNFAILDKSRNGNYTCFWDSDNQLVAYVNITPKSENTVFLGIALAPCFCGKGKGAEILNMGVDIIKARYPGCLIKLNVRAWNIRAIKCYASIGFTIDKTEIITDYKGVPTEFVTMSMQLV